MSKDIKAKVEELATLLGADRCKKSKSWKGYTVFVPKYDEFVIIGIPYVILVRKKSVRLSTINESLAYLNFSNPDRYFL